MHELRHDERRGLVDRYANPPARRRSGIEIAAGFELDPLEVRDQDIRSSGYLATGRPRRDGAARLIESWTCPICKHQNWARITIEGRRVAAIEGSRSTTRCLRRRSSSPTGATRFASSLSGLPAQDLMTGVVDRSGCSLSGCLRYVVAGVLACARSKA